MKNEVGATCHFRVIKLIGRVRNWERIWKHENEEIWSLVEFLGIMAVREGGLTTSLKEVKGAVDKITKTNTAEKSNKSSRVLHEQKLLDVVKERETVQKRLTECLNARITKEARELP